jgi:alanine racemase
MSYRLNIYRHTMAYIHLDNLIENVKTLRKIFGEEKFFCPMIKANAYGHGDVEVALRLEKEGIKTLGVGLVEEGILLRQMGVRGDLLVFGIFGPDALSEVIKWRLTPVVSTWEQLEMLERAPVTHMEIHLKFDTGMHRLGFLAADASTLFQKISMQRKLILRGILTHLHSGEDSDQEFGNSHRQLLNFSEVENIFAPMNPVSHALNSSGLLNFVKLKKQRRYLSGVNTELGARPGLAMYGYHSLAELPEGLQLKAAMSLRSHVVKYHQLAAGESVSYGATWTATQPSIIGIVPIGYADGYHRILSNKSKVMFDGELVSVVGNVCMDYIMIDVTSVVRGRSLKALADQEVTLFGYDSQGRFLSAQLLAQKAQTIPYEILTSVGERVPRIVEGSVFETGKDQEVRS